MSRIPGSTVQIVLLAYLYVFSEWLFFVTKPSFLDLLGFGDKTKLFFVAAIPFVGLALVLHLALAAPYLFGPKKLFRRRWFSILALAPATVATIITVLLVDNFTYTIFRVGIIRTQGFQVYLYLLGVLLSFVGFTAWFSLKLHRPLARPTERFCQVSALSLGLASALSLMLTISNSDIAVTTSQPRHHLRRPNVLIFDTEGLQAKRMSAYGHSRETTPRLDALLPQSFVAQVAISNAANTTGSMTSLLTGKWPTTTKVLLPPQVLLGRHAYEHLPGILRGLGYTLLEESVRYYADTADLNMQLGFHFANGRRLDRGILRFIPESTTYALGNSIHFYTKLKERIVQRALHLAGIRPMEDVYRVVTSDEHERVLGISDTVRIDRAIRFMAAAEQPFFVSIHLMDSHCCSYHPRIRKFSAVHEKQDSSNIDDFYDDAILTADDDFGRLVRALKQMRKFDNTIIVFSSDHTRRWRVGRIPLVIRFPLGKHAQKAKDTVQLIDVAPTILNFMGVDPPAWMEGDSLLSEEVTNPLRPIFASLKVDQGKFNTLTNARVVGLVSAGPPRYGLEALEMIICNRRYILEVGTGDVWAQRFKDHPRPCSERQLPSRDRAREMMEQHLEERGFGLP